MLLPVYAAFAAALVFYLLIPILGAFRLRSRWRRFRERVASLSRAPLLRYGDIASAYREGRQIVGSFRLHGTIEAIEGEDRLWVRGKSVSALLDLSKAPLYVAAPGPAEAGSIERLRWSSVSSLVEGTSIFVAGRIALAEGRPVFVDAPDESLVAVCHDGAERNLISKLTAGGRAQNEYWSYGAILSLAVGLASISGILLLSGASTYSTIRALVFLAGAMPILPLAPPGLALFFAYRRLWRQALSFRTSRDLLRLPLRGGGERRELPSGELAPEGSTWLGPIDGRGGYGGERRRLTLFSPSDPGDPAAETFVVEGDPEMLARQVERQATLYATASGAVFGLAIVVNFVLAFAAWRFVL